MNDQEALLEAARLLRERVSKLPPERWHAEGNPDLHMDGTHGAYDIVAEVPDRNASDLPPRGIMAVVGWGHGLGWHRSEHIAALDPAVALSMAELFEAVAKIPRGMACRPGDPDFTPVMIGPDPKVVALARTYLRDSE